MENQIIRCLTLLAVLGALLPAAALAQAPAAPTGGSEAVAPSPFALSGRGAVLLGHTARFRGRLDRSEAGHTVSVEQLDATTAGWSRQATAVVARDGSFLAAWRPRHIGRFRTRATVARGAGAGASTASPELELTVYRPALATWYGPGLFGKRTACGIELTPELVGVAHRSLPCGTQVALSYRGRTLVAPVIDRGPFRAGTDWDLSAAAATALGFTATDRLGAVALR